MDNPFQLNYPDQVDAGLVKLAIDGDKAALQNLVVRHQVFVYNLALKMTKSTEDAEDLSQEVFIKAITSLSKFEGKSQFRTWLYRITVNHFLNTKKRKAELQVVDFETYFNTIDEMPDHELSHTEQHDLADSIEELRVSCTSGMLLCLNREQRLVYVLGEMFDIDHHLGADIMGISPGNFRIRLMRARQDLYSWMNQRCSLVNKSNPCQCAKKTRAYIAAGQVDPDNLKFNTGYRQKIVELSEKNALSFSNTVEDLHKKVFQQHPLQELPKSSQIVDEILNNNLIKLILKL